MFYSAPQHTGIGPWTVFRMEKAKTRARPLDKPNPKPSEGFSFAANFTTAGLGAPRPRLLEMLRAEDVIPAQRMDIEGTRRLVSQHHARGLEPVFAIFTLSTPFWLQCPVHFTTRGGGRLAGTAHTDPCPRPHAGAGQSKRVNKGGRALPQPPLGMRNCGNPCTWVQLRANLFRHLSSRRPRPVPWWHPGGDPGTQQRGCSGQAGMEAAKNKNKWGKNKLKKDQNWTESAHRCLSPALQLMRTG